MAKIGRCRMLERNKFW